MSEPYLPRRQTDALDLESHRLRQLGERLRRGDEAALELFLDLYWSPLLRYAARLVGGEDAAEDVVQEAFVRLWARRRMHRPDASVAGFLYKTTRNLCLNEKRRRRVRLGLSLPRLLARPDAPATPLEEMEASELDGALRAVIEALPARRREVYTLVREHGLSYREIGAVMGISRQTVANQMSAALDQLRDVLRSHS